MAFWFGRKSAPEVRPFVPAWLAGEADSGDFVRGIEGLNVTERASGEAWQWRSGAWEAGILRCRQVQIGGQVLLRERQPAIPDAANGNVIDTECRAALAAVLSTLRTHGLIG